MSVHSSQKRRRRENSKLKFKGMNHNEFLSRIRKTLYYGKLPVEDTFSFPVTEFAAELYSKVKAGRSIERLRLEEAAEISRNTCASPCSLVLAMLYLERLKTCNPGYLDKVVPSELFLISVMVASKFLNDDGEEDEVLNSEWASSAGLGLREVNRLEKEFLKAIDWEIFVKDTSFWSNLQDMERDIALKEGKRRGWFSYTELERLLDTLDTVNLAQALIAVSVICLASYTAAVLTVVGSTYLVARMPNLYLPTHSVPPFRHSSLERNFTVEMKNKYDEEIPSPLTAHSQNMSADTDNEEVHRNTLLTWLGPSSHGNSTNHFALPSPALLTEANNNCFESVTHYLHLFGHHLVNFRIDAVLTQFSQ